MPVIDASGPVLVPAERPLYNGRWASDDGPFSPPIPSIPLLPTPFSTAVAPYIRPYHLILALAASIYRGIVVFRRTRREMGGE